MRNGTGHTPDLAFQCLDILYLTRDKPVLRQLFPYGKFQSPADNERIAAVESALRIRLPDQLRALYLECDGFREDQGNTRYLLSLIDEESDSLKSLTEFCHSEFRETWPDLDLTPYVFFGSSAADELWGIRWTDGGEIIAFHHHMEGTYEVIGNDILEVYKADYARYR